MTVLVCLIALAVGAALGLAAGPTADAAEPDPLADHQT